MHILGLDRVSLQEQTAWLWKLFRFPVPSSSWRCDSRRTSITLYMQTWAGILIRSDQRLRACGRVNGEWGGGRTDSIFDWDRSHSLQFNWEEALKLHSLWPDVMEKRQPLKMKTMNRFENRMQGSSVLENMVEVLSANKQINYKWDYSKL